MSGPGARVAALADPDLGTVLVLDAEADRAALDRAMALAGLTPEPPVPGSGLGGPAGPAVAAWSCRGGRPFAVITVNPLANIMILDVGTLPPPLRAILAGALPVLCAARLVADLGAADPRMVRRALWGLVAIECIGARPAVEALVQGGVRDPALRAEAAMAAARLAAAERARLAVTVAMRTVAEAAVAVIARMGRPGGLAAVLAGPADCAELFTGDIAPGIAEGLAARPFEAGRGLAAGSVAAADVTAVPAGLLRAPNALSHAFPRGYRLVAGWLRPEPVWLRWTLRCPEGGTVSYDGLVLAGGRWLFCPRPWRLVDAALAANP